MREPAGPGGPGAFAISPRMASALTDPIRSRILAELDLRPMSPSQFVKKLGGEISSTARFFRQLERWGYAEVIEERPAGRRGVATERVYRKLPSPYLERASPEDFPFSEGFALSRRPVISLCAQIVEAVEAGTFDQEPDRHLWWEPTVLDRAGRLELDGHLQRILALVGDLELAPGRRHGNPSDRVLRASIALAAFRSPQPVDIVLKSADWRRALDLTPQLAKALSNQWRSRILRALLAGRPMSPTQFVEETGGDHSYVSRCFRELAAWGYIEVDEERRGGRRGGGIERIYGLTRSILFDTPEWVALPLLVRTEISSTIIASYFERISEAIEAGSFDSDPDRHISWKATTLDRESWTEVGDQLDAVFASLPRLQEEALQRTGNDAEQLIPTVVGAAWFRSPGSNP